MDEQELKEKLYSALDSKAELNDLCEKLQVRDLEREKRYSHAATLIAKLCKGNEMLREDLVNLLSQNESKQKAHVAKIKSLQSENISLKTRINELEVELQEVNSNFDNIANSLSGEINKSNHFLLEFKKLTSQSSYMTFQGPDSNKIESGQEVIHFEPASS